MTTKTSVTRYMYSRLDVHADPNTGGFDAERLAEDAADHFDLYTPDGEIPDWVLDAATIIAEVIIFRNH